MMTGTNSQFVAASLTVFLSVWYMAGEANLNLSTKGGNLDIKFSLSLGNPGAPSLRLLQHLLLTRPATEVLLRRSVIGRELLAIKQPRLQNCLFPALILPLFQ